MFGNFELNDVPRVAASDLQAVLQELVISGRADLLLEGPTQIDRTAFEEEFWQGFSGQTSLGAAIIVRFWALVDVLSSRRINDMLMDRGFVFLRLLADAAASQRLNANRGLNPLQIAWAVKKIEKDVNESPRIRLSPRPVPASARAFAEAA